MRLFSFAALVAIVGIVPLAVHARRTFDREFICPIGGERFRAEVEGSGTVLCQRLDFKRVGLVGEPPLVPECPGNGFIIFSQDLSDSELAKLEPWVGSAEYQEQIRHHPTYYRIARLQEFLGRGSGAVAWSYLRASWQVEGRDQDAHSQYLRAAVSQLEQFASTKPPDREPPGGLTAQKARFLAAELLRRLGEFPAAQHRLQLLLPTLSEDDPLLAATKEELRLLVEQDSKPHAATWSADREGCEQWISRGL